MASVTFSTAVGGDGSTVTDDTNASTGLANGGHRTMFVPALAQVVAVADYVVDTASAFNNGQTWAYDSTTSMADPGTGDIRFNNATMASVTQISVSALSSTSGNPDISDLVMTWDDSTNTTNKGNLTIRKGGTPATFVSFTINAALTDNTTWIQIPVTYVASNGTWTAADQMFVSFSRSGDKGTDGSGDFQSDGSAVMTGSLQLGAGLGVVFEGTTADTFETTLIAGEPTADNVVTLPNSTTTLAGLGVAQSFTEQQTFSAAINEAHGADIASSATINLTTATGNLVDVTGTTTITAITLADGYERTVRFTGALTLTHGASLVLPGGANITTAAGDFAIFRGYAAGVVRCVTYTKAAGTSVVAASGGAWTFLSAVTASNSATVDIETTFDSTYGSYVIVAHDVKPASDGVQLFCRLKIDGTYKADTFYAYHNLKNEESESAYSFNRAYSVGYAQQIIVLDNIGNAANEHGEFELRTSSVASTTLTKTISFDGRSIQLTGRISWLSGAGQYINSNAALTGIRFLASTGNIASGTFSLYGIKNS